MGDKENNQSQQLSDRLSKIESQMDGLRREMVRTRRTVRRTWFYTEFISPLIALAILVGGIYFGVSYVEEHFLGGVSIVDEVQGLLDEK